MSSDQGNSSSGANAETNDTDLIPAAGPEESPPARERPLAVYGVLVLGVVTLLVLLGIIYFSSGDRDKPEQPICTDITAESAMQKIYAGEVESLTVNYDDKGDPQTGDRFGPVLARLEFVNGQCANLPQGVLGSNSIYQVIGVIDFYNDTTESSQVEVNKQRAENLPEALFETPTPIPTETPVPTETPAPTETPEPSPTLVPTEQPTPEATPPPVSAAASPEASASPAASPAA